MASQTRPWISLRTHLLVSFFLTLVLATMLLLGHYSFDWSRQVKFLLLLAGTLIGCWCMLVFVVALTPPEELADTSKPTR